MHDSHFDPLNVHFGLSSVGGLLFQRLSSRESPALRARRNIEQRSRARGTSEFRSKNEKKWRAARQRTTIMPGRLLDNKLNWILGSASTQLMDKKLRFQKTTLVSKRLNFTHIEDRATLERAGIDVIN